jgi:hypothetical protein
MKLTKGKISKLYNKKKQSLKKNKNKKSSSRNNTFRKKRNIHLARKSLKRFHYKKQRGGEDNTTTTPKAQETLLSKTETINQPLPENSNNDISSNEDSSPSVIPGENNNQFEETVTQVETTNDTPFEETVTQVETTNDTPFEETVTQVETPTSEENTQNGFDSVNAAVETMAISGGKRRKTRKFKLTNKNKTKHQ